MLLSNDGNWYAIITILHGFLYFSSVPFMYPAIYYVSAKYGEALNDMEFVEHQHCLGRSRLHNIRVGRPSPLHSSRRRLRS